MFVNRLPRLVGLLVALVGMTVLCGWALDISVLKSIRSGWVTMKANTALGFLLPGLALWATRGMKPA